MMIVYYGSGILLCILDSSGIHTKEQNLFHKLKIAKLAYNEQ